MMEVSDLLEEWGAWWRSIPSPSVKQPKGILAQLTPDSSYKKKSGVFEALCRDVDNVRQRFDEDRAVSTDKAVSALRLNDKTLYRATFLYYCKELSDTEIAERLKKSRSKSNQLRKEARIWLEGFLYKC